jgi:ribosome-associated translation inhibitor RaiA
MDVEIQALHSDVHPRWRGLINRRAKKLVTLSDQILRLHVTMVHDTHHQHGHEEVRLLAAVPDETLRVRKTRPSMGDALHGAFSALEREVRHFVARRRG